MKQLTKIAISFLAGISALSVSAQNDAARIYTPEAGDFAVGIDLVPLLRTLGGSDNNDATPVGGTPFTANDMYCRPTVSIMGKYMFSDSWGLKVNLGLTVDNRNYRSYVTDDKLAVLEPLNENKVIDSQKKTNTGVSLMAGAEYRLGKRRIQGVFGMGALLGYSSHKYNYSYGNAITEFNQDPTYTDFGGYNVPGGYRPTEMYTDGIFMAGLYGSVGAEWFVAPKLAIGADVKLAFYGLFGGKEWTKSEGWSAEYQALNNRTDLISPGNRGFNLSTDNIGGSLYMTFYF